MTAMACHNKTLSNFLTHEKFCTLVIEFVPISGYSLSNFEIRREVTRGRLRISDETPYNACVLPRIHINLLHARW